MKSKGKAVWYLTKHHAMHIHGKMEAQIHAFLTSALGDAEWSASRHVAFAPKKERRHLSAGSQGRSGGCGDDKNPALPVTEPQAPSLATGLTEPGFTDSNETQW
jgi:hypothetical protein